MPDILGATKHLRCLRCRPFTVSLRQLLALASSLRGLKTLDVTLDDRKAKSADVLTRTHSQDTPQIFACLEYMTLRAGSLCSCDTALKTFNFPRLTSLVLDVGLSTPLPPIFQTVYNKCNHNVLTSFCVLKEPRLGTVPNPDVHTVNANALRPLYA